MFYSRNFIDHFLSKEIKSDIRNTIDVNHQARTNLHMYCIGSVETHLWNRDQIGMFWRNGPFMLNELLEVTGNSVKDMIRDVKFPLWK